MSGTEPGDQRPEHDGGEQQRPSADDGGRYGPYARQAAEPQPGEPQYGQYGQQPQRQQQPQYGQYGQPQQTGQHGQRPQQGQQQPPQYGQYAPHGPQPQPQYGQYGQYGQPQQPGQPVPPSAGGWGQPPAGGQYGQYGQYGGGPAPAGFAGAVQPGIVPLRPLTIGEILDGGFRAIRANPKVMFGLSLLVLAVASVIETIILYFLLDEASPFLTDPFAYDPATDPFAPGADPSEVLGLSAGALVSSLAAGVAVWVASIILTGLLILSVSQSVLGHRVSVGEVWTRAKGQIWRLVGLTLLLGVGGAVLFFVVVFAFAALIGVAFAGLGQDALGVAVLLAVLLFLAAVVVVAFFAVRLGLAAPALMLERSGVGTALRRSWSLTGGQFWRIFGALVLAALIVWVISAAVMVPVSILTAFGAYSESAVVGTVILSTVISTLVSALTTPFLAAVLALVYIDVRMRKEGLDVELARAAGAGRGA
ncbi:glycerophosphoryl diester phosphodiesterase membrane domain-containing protein [Georgenia sp. TF02-10]|uniref:glycerophosphoryl diester phosphodiesterase membrane domain-containing protein n=1 Tax=Georgenia sp. TF02-10 TaxID=2917725 RepID=UPI001FA6B459|nr:glycerophosphoryl diester phosphodiesterase membrane domain-containing protein [Georgenia sp. TF02-10]UNX55812.1 glycerophosphoryl diester phosphodiesterase membrane domain-containing protein [Georgenia sp. TF02-10]